MLPHSLFLFPLLRSPLAVARSIYDVRHPVGAYSDTCVARFIFFCSVCLFVCTPLLFFFLSQWTAGCSCCGSRSRDQSGKRRNSWTCGGGPFSSGRLPPPPCRERRRSPLCCRRRRRAPCCALRRLLPCCKLSRPPTCSTRRCRAPPCCRRRRPRPCCARRPTPRCCGRRRSPTCCSRRRCPFRCCAHRHSPTCC